MASFEPGTAYVNDWQHHDFVETADYESPRDIPPERLVAGLKVKLDDTVFGVTGVGSPLAFGDAVRGAVAWTPTEPTLELVIDGVLILDESGKFIIRAAQRSRFGHWALTVEPLREDGYPHA